MLVVLCAASAMTSAAAQTGRPLRVLVIDTSGAPLQDALVSWMPSGLRGRSDAQGIARFDRVPRGAEVLSVRRLGYRSFSSPVALDSTTREEIKVLLTPVPTELNEVSVSETPGLPWLSEFDRRRRQGKGRFVTLEDINAAHGSALGTLLQRRVPGIMVNGPNSLEQWVFSLRGQNSFAGECQVAVYIDGIREPSGNAAAMPMMLLGGIEYYTPSTVPVEYKEPSPVSVRGGPRGGSAACGVLLMWTR